MKLAQNRAATTRIEARRLEGLRTRIGAFLSPLRPSTNPVLAITLRLGRRHLRRSKLFWLMVALVMANAAYSALVIMERIEPFKAQTEFDFHFTAFHLALYLAPILLILPQWRRLARQGFFEEMMLAGRTRAELLFAFLAPRLMLILGFLFAFHVVLLPWQDWWLVRFGQLRILGGSGDDIIEASWTRWHCLITMNYFITVLTFNSVAVVWCCLRRRIMGHAVLLLILVVLIADYLIYSVGIGIWYGLDEGFAALIAERNWLISVIWIYPWPMTLYYMLYLHSSPYFAAIFYPLKWCLTALMIRDITRRIPHERWGSG